MKISRFKLITAMCFTALLATTMILAIAAFCYGEDDTRAVSADRAISQPSPRPLQSTPIAWQPDKKDVEYIAKTLYGECVGVKSETEKAAVVWCILNRVDTYGYACGTSVEHVVTFPNQFHGYDPDHPVIDELKELTIDVMKSWNAEKCGEKNVGRVLPRSYIYFVGNGKVNYFTNEYRSRDYWEFSYDSPYES